MTLNFQVRRDVLTETKYVEPILVNDYNQVTRNNFFSTASYIRETSQCFGENPKQRLQEFFACVFFKLSTNFEIFRLAIFKIVIVDRDSF